MIPQLEIWTSIKEIDGLAVSITSGSISPAVASEEQSWADLEVDDSDLLELPGHKDLVIGTDLCLMQTAYPGTRLVPVRLIRMCPRSLAYHPMLHRYCVRERGCCWLAC